MEALLVLFFSKIVWQIVQQIVSRSTFEWRSLKKEWKAEKKLLTPACLFADSANFVYHTKIAWESFGRKKVQRKLGDGAIVS